MVETAIAIPLLLVLMVGIFEVGRAYETWQVLTNAAREGARMSVTPSGTPANTTALVRQYMADGQLDEFGDGDGRRQQGRVDQCERHPHQRVARDGRLSVRVHHAAAGASGWSRQAPRSAGRSPCTPRRSCATKLHRRKRGPYESRHGCYSVFLIALLAGGALAFGTYNYLQNVPVKTVTVPTKRVVVANADLSLGSELRPDDLKTVEWPASAVPEGAFDDPAKLLGRGLIVVGRAARADSSGQAGVEGSRQRPAADHPAGQARHVGAGQRGDRRRGVRASGHARRRRRDAEPEQPRRGHDVESRAVERRGAHRRHAPRARHARTASRCR